MAPDREHAILNAVSQALDHPPESRAELLRMTMGDDSVSLLEAQSLLHYRSRNQPLPSTQNPRGFAAGEMVAQRFRVLRLIGRGGMGDVYEVEDTAYSRDRRVALKTIRSDLAMDSQAVEQFKREIGLGQAITHPNVCRIYDLGLHTETGHSHDGGHRMAILFLTMELLGGYTLSARLRSTGPMKPLEALPLIRQMADALTSAHEVNIVHRDFKPGNVMLVQAKGDVRAVVTDFGLAIDLSGLQGRGAWGGICGTPDYMSPEQVLGEPLGCSSDIYALGVVLYEMLTGQLPFDGRTPGFRMVERLHTLPIAPSRRNPWMEPDWSPQILHCLERDPSVRFASANQFANALTASISTDRPTETLTRDAIRGQASPNKVMFRRNRILRLVLTAVAASLMAIAAWVGRTRVLEWLDPLPAERRIAIIRFENIGSNEEDRAFSDGLMQTLASQLTQLEPLQGALSIVPASEIRKENVTTAREAAILFGATLAITGSVQRTSGRVSLIVNLVDTRKLKQLRSTQIEVKPDETAYMQQLVVSRVAEMIQVELQPAVVKRLAQSSTAVPRAYDYYLQGLGYLAKRDGEDHAISEFQRALGQDPAYALAYAGLGEAYWAKYVATKDRAWVGEAWKQSQKAIQLNPHLARPHVALAILNYGTGKYLEAVRQARYALAIDPSSEEAHVELAKALDKAGDEHSAEAILKQTVALRPTGLNYSRLGDFYFSHARYAAAEQQYRRVIELTPDSPAGHTNLGGTALLLGQYQEAEMVLQHSMQLQPTFAAASNLATLYFFEGRYAEAVPIMERQVQSQPKNYVLWGNLGDDYRWAPGHSEDATKAYAQAIALTVDVLAVNPQNMRALSAQALYRAKSGETRQALAAVEKSLRGGSHDQDVLFDAAVVHEIAHDRTGALRYLSQAVRAGYSPTDVKTDPELASLRQDARYLELLSSTP